MSLEVPNYYDGADRELYEKLILNYDKLSEKERHFVNIVYHQEEFASGLDGDRE